MEIKLFDSVDEKSWDQLVASAPGGNIYQTSRWASYLRKYMGLRSFFLRVEESGSGSPLALLRVTRDSPIYRFVFEKPFGRILAPIANRLTASLKWEAGPVFLCNNGRKAIFETILAKVESFCRESGIISIGGVYNNLYEPSETPGVVDCSLQDRGYKATEKATFLVDLRPDEDVLWRAIKRSARKSIRRSREQGLRVERLKKESELARYHEFYCLCRRSQGLSETPLSNISEMWRQFYSAGMLEIFCAYRNEKLLGALGAWKFGGVVIEWGSVQSEKAREDKLYSSDLLKWELMRWGHQNGCRLYDLAGVSPQHDNINPKQQGIYQFKAKWGGAYKNYNIYSKPLKKVRAGILHKSLSLARSFRS